MRHSQFEIEVEIPKENAKLYKDKDFEAKKTEVVEKIAFEQKEKMGFFSIFGLFINLAKSFKKNGKGKDIAMALNPEMQKRAKLVEQIENPPAISKDIKNVR